ncbi:MAG TPA: pyridoxamine 5'-phosphate oxidase family protein [Patescibacteria group bacterium]|nr:pyridoxamine 5'-phosphate oxidase family protein [Patescibacteria group bacterium]
MNTELARRAREIISNIIYITIATADKNGQPWNSPVYSAFDENYNFYWNSWKESQHSKNISENPHVFLAIYNSTLPEGSGAHIGVYVQAKAEIITYPDEIETARKILQDRKAKPSSKLRDKNEFLGDYPRRVYRAVPEKMWLNDTGEINGNYIDKRVEIDLKELRGL